MGNNPEISILNLIFNSGERVLKTLESIKNQTFQNFEVICIDDASSDDSYEIISNWLDNNAGFPFIHLKNEINLGITKSLNQALSQAKGKFISVICDDIWHPDFLKTLHRIISSNKQDADIIYAKSDVYNIHEAKYVSVLDPIQNAGIIKYPRITSLFRKIEDKIYFLEGNLLKDHIFWINPVISFSFLGKYELFSNGYTDRYWMEDMPKWYEIAKKTNYLYVDEVLATYVIHGKNSTLTRSVDISISVLQFLRDNFEEICFNDTKRKVESRIAFMFINKELLIKHLIKDNLRQIIKYFIKKQPSSFFRILLIIAKETAYKWKMKLFRL